MRYKFVLTPCKATGKSSWHAIIAEADSILQLWDKVGWRATLNHDQEFVILDTKKGVTLNEGEYRSIIHMLKGW